MTILIADNSPRISYTATSGQTAFTVPFEFFDNTDLNVYINDTLQTLTTHYTVTGGSGSTGSITLVTGATAGDVIVITRDVTLERTTDFPTSGPFQVASLNTELDKVVAMIADMKDLADRGLRLSDSDTSATLVLANKDTRKGTVLAFNETTGAVEVGPTIADTNTIAQIKADIATLADIQDGTVATNAITTVSSIAPNVTTVAGISSQVTTVAGQTTNLQNVTDNLTDIQNAATNATNAAASATAAASSATAAATSETNAGTSETNAATSATNASNSASAASTSASAASTSATAAASSATAAATSETNAGTSETNAATSATNAATSATNAGTSETNAASSATAAAASATSASNAQTAAESARDSALASFDSFDDRYLGAKTSDPTVDNDGNALVAGALYFNSTDGEMKVYNGTSWVDAYADGASLVAKSGDTMTGDLSFGDNNQVIFGDGNDLRVTFNGTDGNILLTHPANLNVSKSGGDNFFQILSQTAGGAGLKINSTTTGGSQVIDAVNTSLPLALQHGGTTKVTIDADGLDVDSGVLVADSTNDTVAINYNSTINSAYSLQVGYAGSGGYIGLYGSTYFTGNTTVQHSDGTTVSFASYTSGNIGVTFYNNTFWRVSPYDAAQQRCDARDDSSTQSRLHWYGQNDSGGTSNFRHAYYTGSNYVNVTAQSSNDLLFGGDILATGNITAYSSDERLKENIQTIEGGLDKVCQLRGVTFDWRDDCEEKGFVPDMKSETGFIAQEVQKVIPDAVVPAPFDSLEGHQSGEDYLTVNPQKVIPVLVEAIKELKAEIEELKNASAE